MSLTSGSRLGPYEIGPSIGAGGMGEVFRARDTKLGRDVAVKVLPAAFAQDGERVARFKREAQVLASLNHPNIAAIYGFEESTMPGATTPVIALILELVEGEDLQQRLKRGAIPVDEARAIGAQIAEGLEVANEKGVLHRDLKPGNIKVTPSGEVKVLDFGLAKAIETGTSSSAATAVHDSPTMSVVATEAGYILGTAAYMSPEQARGKPLDKRSDIWSFGVVLFEMMSGKRLFVGETTSDILAAVLRQDIDWTLLPKDLSLEDRRLIERCLERDPRKRLRDMGEARIALSREVAPTSEKTQTVPLALTRRNWIQIASAGAGGLIAGVGLGRRGAPKIVPGTTSSLNVTPITNSGTVIEAAISPDGRYVAYVESLQGQQSLWLTQLAGGQTLRLTPDEKAFFWGHTFSPDGNNIIFGQRAPTDPAGGIFSISTLGGAPRRLLTGMDSQVSFSPDGKKFAYNGFVNRDTGTGDTCVMVAMADGSNPKPLATFKLPEIVAGIFFGAPSWSPDGKTVATIVFRNGTIQGAESRARLVAIDTDTGAVRTISDPGWIHGAQCAWLPDGKSLLVIARATEQAQDQIWAVSTTSGEASTFTADLSDHRVLSLTRDGRTLVSISGDISSSVWVGPMNGSDKPHRVSRSRYDGIDGVALDRDGGVLYTANIGSSWSIWRADADGAHRASIFATGADEAGFRFALASDGTVYYTVRSRKGIEIRATRRDGTNTRTVIPNVRSESISLLPDDDTLVFVAVEGGRPRIFSASVKGGPRKALVDVTAYSPAVDPSGKRVAFYFIDKDGRVQIGVASMDEGPAITFSEAAAPDTSQSRIRLRDEGIYVNTVPGDRANVWLIPTDGKPHRRITNYEDQTLFDFDISRDGKTLAIVRGPRVRDAQLFTGFERLIPRS